MRFDPNPVVWAGVVLRHKDGTVQAVQLDGRQYQIDYELGWEAEFADAAPYGWRQSVPTGYETVTVRLSGHGRPWRNGADVAEPPAQAIAEAPRRLEAS